ncbi:phage tail protein [Streptomyces stelliscabiei]|uniref:phage tail protein n=1 Tax=Streptomyces stelliscabiei TaxID=146820 RepID=UPI0029A98169|nr:phage tail protein [Streptomyces stelliscabiei]MDX2551322.1 phage tail protein [Streptomyces stelliscabiei]
MLRISAAALAALGQATARPVRAEWSNDGGQTWTPARFGSGGVTPDRTAEVRYSAAVELLDAPRGRHGINSVATEVRLFQGIGVPRRDVEWIPAGRYSIDRLRRTRLGVSLDLLGREDIIRSASLPTARTIGPDTARACAGVLIGEALPGAPVAWREGVKATTQLPAVVVDEDRWAALSGGTDSSGTATGIAASLGAEVYADAQGVIVFASVPTLADAVVWRIPRQLVTAQPAQEETAEGLVNLWAVSGDSGSGTVPVGPAFAWDDDPGSLTYAGPDPVGDPLAPQRLGLPGVRVRTGRYTSPLIASMSQATDVARARLADSLGVQSSLSFTSVCNPALEAGDVVEVEVEDGVWERHLIDSCPYTLGGITQTCQTRTSTRRL